MIGARESKFFHHLSIILSCKNSLFTCKNYCKMMKDTHKNREAPLTSSGASSYALVCRSARVLQAGSNAGDGAEDQIDESCLLALRELSRSPRARYILAMRSSVLAMDISMLSMNVENSGHSS